MKINPVSYNSQLITTLLHINFSVMEARPQTVENESIQALAGTIDASHIEYTRIPLIKVGFRIYIIPFFVKTIARK